MMWLSSAPGEQVESLASGKMRQIQSDRAAYRRSVDGRLLEAAYSRQWAGATPYSRLNARLNASSDSQPTIGAIWPMLFGVPDNSHRAVHIRCEARYCIGGLPPS
jgi:hypothetical protein